VNTQLILIGNPGGAKLILRRTKNEAFNKAIQRVAALHPAPANVFVTLLSPIIIDSDDYPPLNSRRWHQCLGYLGFS